MILNIYTDGGARNNPGPAACGIVFKNEQGKILKKFYKYCGKLTNNQAEYNAVIYALEEAVNFNADELKFFLDSKLVVEQLNRNYKVKHNDLAPLFVKVWNLTLKFKKVSFTYIPREDNKEADKLVNECLDKNM
jgi:ribonuclease HI